MKYIEDFSTRASIEEWAKKSEFRASDTGVLVLAYILLGCKGILYWMAGFLASLILSFLVKCLELKWRE